MMKKTLLIFAFLMLQNAFAQIVSKDLTFANNGIFSISNTSQTNNYGKIIQNSDGSLYFTSLKGSAGNYQTIVSKLAANGSLDTSFGNNGETAINLFSYNSFLTKQSDGKILIYCFTDNSASIVRILSNGQIDNTFGNSGISTIANLGYDLNVRSFGQILQNGKILVLGVATQNSQYLGYQKVYRLNSNGIIDTTFGNSGSINTQGNFFLIDNQSNIVCISNGSNNASNNSILEKYDLNGQPLSSFGTNGVLNLTFNLNYAGQVIIDSNNKIVFSNLTNEIRRINADGTLDNSFNFSFPSFNTWILSIVEKNGSYYIAGNSEGANMKYFISKLNQNGTLDSAFNYFLENDSNLTEITDMVVNDANIIVIGSSYVVKYLFNTSSLSTNEINKNDEVYFENPAKQNLNFENFEKISIVEILSLEGKLVKTIKENNSDISELPKGIYIVRTKLKNGKTLAKKLVKI